jgi:hypothetical protein
MNGYQCICRVSADQGHFGQAEETVYESGISKLVAGCGAFFPFSALHCAMITGSLSVTIPFHDGTTPEHYDQHSA